MGSDISPMPAASWPNACAMFAACRKAHRSGKPDAVSSSATSGVNVVGDEVTRLFSNPGCRFLVRDSSRRLLRHGEGESSAVPLIIRATGLRGVREDL